MTALAEVLRERALRFLTQHKAVPSKAQVRRAASQHPFKREDLEELSKHPGSSRSTTLDAVKAIASERTGCVVATPTQERRIGQIAVRSGKVVIIPQRRQKKDQ